MGAQDEESPAELAGPDVDPMWGGAVDDAGSRVTLQLLPKRGRFLLVDRGGEAQGELTFERPSADVAVATHTWVAPELRGQGAARRLFHALTRWAREDGARIRPVCSYVVWMFDREPQHRDLLAP